MHASVKRGFHPTQRKTRNGRNVTDGTIRYYWIGGLLWRERPITAASDDGVCRWHAAKLWQTRHKIWSYWN